MEADRSNLFICDGDVGEITVCPPPLKYKNKHSKQKLSLSKLPVWLPIAAQIKGGNRNNSDTNSRGWIHRKKQTVHMEITFAH